jgi:hypothetical protein
MDDGHQVYRIHSDVERGDLPRDEVAVVEALDVFQQSDDEELALSPDCHFVVEEFDWMLLEIYFECHRDH